MHPGKESTSYAHILSKYQYEYLYLSIHPSIYLSVYDICMYIYSISNNVM